MRCVVCQACLCVRPQLSGGATAWHADLYSEEKDLHRPLSSACSFDETCSMALSVASAPPARDVVSTQPTHEQ